MIPQLPEIPTDPVVGLAIVAVAVNALSAYLSYRVTRSLAPAIAELDSGTGRERSPPSTDDEVTVGCRECGSENELGYRYCRECVAELPAPAGFGRSRSVGAGRLVG